MVIPHQNNWIELNWMANWLARIDSHEVVEKDRGSDWKFWSKCKKSVIFSIFSNLNRFEIVSMAVWLRFLIKNQSIRINQFNHMFPGRWPNDLESNFGRDTLPTFEISINRLGWPNDLGFAIRKGGTCDWNWTPKIQCGIEKINPSWSAYQCEDVLFTCKRSLPMFPTCTLNAHTESK